MEVEDINIPDDLKYTKTSEWIRVEGNIGQIGITDYAQKELTDIVFVEPPQVDAEFEAGGEFGRIGHDRNILEAFAVQPPADRADHAVHHTGRRDHIGAGLGGDNRLLCQILQRLIVVHHAFGGDHAAVAVRGVFAETGIGHHQRIG